MRAHPICDEVCHVARMRRQPALEPEILSPTSVMPFTDISLLHAVSSGRCPLNPIGAKVVLGHLHQNHHFVTDHTRHCAQVFSDKLERSPGLEECGEKQIDDRW